MSTFTKFSQVAATLAANGYRPVPIRPGEKKPVLKDWTQYAFRDTDARKFGNAGCGILTGEVRAVDIDVRNEKVAALIERHAVAVLGIESKAPRRIGAWPKTMILVRSSAGPKLQTRGYLLESDTADNDPHKVEILGTGQQLVGYGIHPNTKRPYEWNGAGDPLSVPFLALPFVEEALLRRLVADCEEILSEYGRPCGRLGRDTAGTVHAPNEQQRGDHATVADALQHIHNENLSRDDWILIGMALKGALGEAGRELFVNWSRSCPKSGKSGKTDTPEKTWATLQPTRIGAGTLYFEAARNGWERQAIELQKKTRPPAGGDVVVFEGAPLVLSESNLADAFAAAYDGKLLYNHTTGKWHLWTGTHWKPDDTRAAFEWVRRFTGKLNTDGRAKWAKASVFSAVERIATAHRAFARTAEAFDSDLWIVGTPGGVVDLRTGQLRPASPQDMITRVTGCPPAEPGTPAPMWDKFLHQATGEDADLIRFLRAVCGYALSGLTVEHLLVFIFGLGGNGKGVFIDTLAGVFGDYAQTAAISTFTATTHERHPTELAHMKGARLVTASETEQNHTWAESRIKMLTGGDKVRARFLFREEFEYLPQFQLIIIGNFKPRLNSVDEAMRRRLHLIDFCQTPRRKDPMLRERLRAEWPQILRWCIDGCLDWQKNGLNPPETVLQSTAAYFAEQDLIGAWVNDCCQRGAHYSESATALFKSWTEWARAAGEDPGTQRQFGDALNRLGIYRRKTRAVVERLGIRLSAPARDDARHPGAWD